ncbi:hypothetical protein BD324DRAFT_234792 [Kockovaella imperatae]|uniref:alpha-1,6-mannosyl-glycoprotein 6-beta-N-acetylglucosaminyltransferase n=1 Tax=Kockovaella imperatae TaxID=4999 RepID=A0A1Y1UP14_9TREE|nr:hypothetical protein BD324DRAFT_234792 [Kockovaella imperatae]ORX39788.1 hypothetical protein BD324DRAFT_234792 [Kockovaella imperatae]
MVHGCGSRRLWILEFDLGRGGRPARVQPSEAIQTSGKGFEARTRGRTPSWTFTHSHNIHALQSLLSCYLPLSDPAHVDCPPRPLIIAGWWYTALVLEHATTGETIWMTSLVEMLDELRFFWIAVGPYENWIEVVEMVPDIYRSIWVADVEIVSCVTDPRCIAAADYTPPIGEENLSRVIPDEDRGSIPIWALTVVDYWGARPLEIANNDYWWGLTEYGDWTYHPLGQQWIATPWPQPGHTHLPYSIEKSCLALSHIPQQDRNDSILIYAKRSRYFDFHYVSPRSFWTQLAAEKLNPRVTILTTAREEPDHQLPDGLVVLPRQTRTDYEHLVGNVKAILGIGAPSQSPSVYTALCQGTPVIVPYFEKNMRQDGWYRYSGTAQHGPAASIGEPYVYTYYAQNYDSLLAAVQKAVTTPIQRYIPPDMRYDYALTKMKEFLDRDTQGDYERIVRRRGGVPPLQAGLRERCYELGRCRPTLPPGQRSRVL